MMHHEGVVNMWVKCQPSQLGEQCCKESWALLLNFIHNVVILLECIRYVCYVLWKGVNVLNHHFHIRVCTRPSEDKREMVICYETKLLILHVLLFRRLTLNVTKTIIFYKFSIIFLYRSVFERIHLTKTILITCSWCRVATPRHGC